MKNMFSRIITAVLCAAMVCTLPAFAAETQPAQPEAGSPQPYPMAPVRVWGRVTKLDSGGLLVQNSNENDPYHEIILHGESIPILDAVTGLPLDRDLRDGEVIYAWVGPAMTMSLPPHATAQIIVANIPQDAGAPQYYQVAKVRAQGDGPERVELVTTDGTPVFSILPGQATAHTPTGERELTGQCLNDRSTTYLPAADLTELLELFAVYEG